MLWGRFLSHLSAGRLSGLPLANLLALSALSPYLASPRALPCVHVHLLAKMDSSSRKKLTGPYYDLANPSLLWPLRNISAHVWCGRSPWPQEWEIHGLFVFYPSRMQLLLAAAIIFILKYLSIRDRFQLLSLGPIYLLPHSLFIFWSFVRLITNIWKNALYFIKYLLHIQAHVIFIVKKVEVQVKRLAQGHIATELGLEPKFSDCKPQVFTLHVKLLEFYIGPSASNLHKHTKFIINYHL